MADEPQQPSALELAQAALSEAITSIGATKDYERGSDARRSLRAAGNRQFELAGRCAAVSIAESLATIAEQLELDADGHRRGA